jgi:hypothetical protein
MHFKASDLNQLTPEYVSRLHRARVDELLELMRKDLLNARDQLNSNSSNSSSPPSTDKPWSRGTSRADDEQEEKALIESIEAKDTQDRKDEEDQSKPQPPSPQNQGLKQVEKKKPGKQKGAKGFGRRQKLPVTHTVIHREECCVGCGSQLAENLPFTASLAFYQLDLEEPEPGKIGLNVTNTKHVFGSVVCPCGFTANSHPNRVPADAEWSVELSEWRLIGPTLLALIVFLKLRMHATLSKTRDFFATWLGISLSDGCINRALREAGRAAASMEPALRQALQQAGLLYVDESTWWQHKITRWIWVARGDGVVYYAIGDRTKEMAQELLKGFQGDLMSDGCQVYRHMDKRLRCWAHLDRKAKGLQESWDKTTSKFGKYVVATFKELREAVYRMRELPKAERQAEEVACDEKRLELIAHCLRHKDSEHKGVGSFAFEILNDHQAIFRVLKEADLPLTNNLAEQALRPVVIMRKISYGSKSEEGSKTVAYLASVVGTVTMRGHECWSYLRDLFAGQRKSKPPPHLPLITVM